MSHLYLAMILWLLLNLILDAHRGIAWSRLSNQTLKDVYRVVLSTPLSSFSPIVQTSSVSRKCTWHHSTTTTTTTTTTDDGLRCLLSGLMTLNPLTEPFIPCSDNNSTVTCHQLDTDLSPHVTALWSYDSRGHTFPRRWHSVSTVVTITLWHICHLFYWHWRL